MKIKNNYCFLRHGLTIYQQKKKDINYKKEENPFIPLAREGKKMIKESAKNLKDKRIDLIFSSPFLRTKQTAEIVAKFLGIEKIYYDQRLRDIDLGELSGKLKEESKNFYFAKGKTLNQRPKGGESWSDVLKRVSSFIKELEKKYKDKNILIISHADPIWLMAGKLKGYKSAVEFLDNRKEGEKLSPPVGGLLIINKS